MCPWTKESTAEFFYLLFLKSQNFSRLVSKGHVSSIIVALNINFLYHSKRKLIIPHCTALFFFKLRKPFQVYSLLWVERKAHDRFSTVRISVELIFSNILSVQLTFLVLVSLKMFSESYEHLPYIQHKFVDMF